MDEKFDTLEEKFNYFALRAIYLKEKGIELAKTTKEQIYDENFNIYKAFGVAEEKLYLSYSASDNDGKGLRKSVLILIFEIPQLIAFWILSSGIPVPPCNTSGIGKFSFIIWVLKYSKTVAM